MDYQMTNMPDNMIEAEIENFRAHLIREEKSGGTVEKYLRDVRSFFHFLPDIRVTKEQTLAWKEHLVGAGYATATVNSMLASLNSFLRFLGRTECCVRPLRRQRRIFRDRDRELSKEEYLRLLRAAEQEGKRRLYFILQTISATGIRISELRFITVQSLKTRRAEVECKGKQRVVLLTEKLCRALRGYCRETGISSGPVFVTKSGPFQYLDGDETPVQRRGSGGKKSLSPQSQASVCQSLLPPQPGHREAGRSAGAFEHRHDENLYHGERPGT